MGYQRPKSSKTLSPAEKKQLIDVYFTFYREQAQKNPDSLNQKVPRECFESVLDEIGSLILQESRALANRPGPVKAFLDSNPLPPMMRDLLHDDFRCFCLLLNALKQWLSAEQAASDRYLLGGTAKSKLRQASSICIASGRPLAEGTTELHHTLRDGRPPIPLLKEEHSRIEGQGAHENGGDEDEILHILKPAKTERNMSWTQLREGLQFLQAEEAGKRLPAARPGAKSFARKAKELTGKSAEELLEWMDDNDLGEAR